MSLACYAVSHHRRTQRVHIAADAQPLPSCRIASVPLALTPSSLIPLILRIAAAPLVLWIFAAPLILAWCVFTTPLILWVFAAPLALGIVAFELAHDLLDVTFAW